MSKRADTEWKIFNNNYKGTNILHSNLLHFLQFYTLSIGSQPNAHNSNVKFYYILCFLNLTFSENIHFIFQALIMKIYLLFRFTVLFSEFLSGQEMVINDKQKHGCSASTVQQKLHQTTCASITTTVV
jgi:hypothetical protein